MSSGHRGKSRLKLAIGKLTITPRAISPPKQKRFHIELSRKTKITKTDANGEKTEIEIDFDDLTHGQLIGRGCCGTVRKMHHKPSGMIFASKMILDSVLETSDRPNGDIEVPRQVGDSCPYIVKYFGALHAESYIWVLTELMDSSLDRFYTKSFSMGLPVSESFISKVAFSVLNALEVLRAHSIMHRDIKPSNILLNVNGEIKVCDFGISGFVSNSIGYTIIGSQVYMPPEKIKPREGEGYKMSADIWSLGISLCELANGVHPYKQACFIELVQKIVADPSPKLDEEKFSPEFCQFIDKCLVKEPDRRSDSIQLLQEPFITKHQDKKIDLGYVKKVIEEINKDPVED